LREKHQSFKPTPAPQESATIKPTPALQESATIKPTPAPQESATIKPTPAPQESATLDCVKTGPLDQILNFEMNSETIYQSVNIKPYFITIRN